MPEINNGTKEAITELKKDRDTLFDRIHEIEIKGCPLGHQILNNNSLFRKEFDKMKDNFDRIQRQQTIWLGAISVLIPLVTVFLSVIVRKYL